MNNIEYFDEQLERFLKKQMPEQEEQVFLQGLQNNPDLLDRAKTMASTIMLMKGIRIEYGNRVVNKIKGESESEYRRKLSLPSQFIVPAALETLPARRLSIAWKKVVRLAVAACFVGMMAFGSYRYYQYDQTVKLGNDYYAVVPSEFGVRDACKIVVELKQLFKNVEDGNDLENTITKLTVLFDESRSDTYNDYMNYCNDIGWNLAIAYLKSGNRDGAVSVLQIIIQDNADTTLASKAQELIDKIHDI